jgi:hypothetical protein
MTFKQKYAIVVGGLLVIIAGYFYYQNVQQNTNYLFITDVVHVLIDIKEGRENTATTTPSMTISNLEWAYGMQEQLANANSLMQPWSISDDQNIKKVANQMLLLISDEQDGTSAFIRSESGEFPAAAENDIALATVKLNAGQGGLTDVAVAILTDNLNVSQSQKSEIVAYINSNFADDIKTVHDNTIASSTNYSLQDESWAALMIWANLK